MSLDAAPRFTKTARKTSRERLEEKLKFALATKYQMYQPTDAQRERIEGDIASLRAQLAAPEPARTPPKPRTEPSEAEILKAIMALLHRHPKVAKAWRQNSMTAKFMTQGGKQRFVRANTAKGMADIQFLLKTGRSGFIEVKTPSGKVMPHQQQFLDEINAGGGLAFVARSVDDALEALAAV